jgi:hypothetical protein
MRGMCLHRQNGLNEQPPSRLGRKWGVAAEPELAFIRSGGRSFQLSELLSLIETISLSQKIGSSRLSVVALFANRAVKFTRIRARRHCRNWSRKRSGQRSRGSGRARRPAPFLAFHANWQGQTHRMAWHRTSGFKIFQHQRRGVSAPASGA